MLRWIGPRMEEQGDLFALFAALSRSEVESFPALRPHQRQAWHSFLVQCAAMALIRAGQASLPADPAAWRALLIGLTPEWPEGEAWELVSQDWLKPALLQPPLETAEDRKDFKTTIETADELDMLVTSRNHDVKAARISAGRDDDWLFALVTLQTMEGFLGAGNYGISRMNGGFANRMALGIQPAGNLSAAFARDVKRLVEVAASNARSGKGIAVLWAMPWDGTRQLSFAQLDPLYVDICRRVRLKRDADGALCAMTAGSKVTRVAAAGLNGNTGDPWAPIRLSDNASISASPGTFGYRKFTELLDRAKTGRPLLSLPTESDAAEGLAIFATALVRGQGKTEGLHRRVIPVSRSRKGGRLGDAFLDRMGQVAQVRAVEAGEVRKRLRMATMSLMQGGPTSLRLDDDSSARKCETWLQSFELGVDRVFFDPAFWDEFEEAEGNHRLVWRTMLTGLANDVFEQAAEAAPRTDVRRVRAQAIARNMLDATLAAYIREVR
ncbi:CRISPR system Cascade subunit CasA [Sphingobium fontiphilum]|uniref:CRISPR system Cascade subunit CasA n=1 Tax=Sphingobium fontiphilum TaxID=944425 RepID=A0A7W6GP78_9SPHN|nr:type I-E CRISPR-associated protein Cse1/CasA [Sphingobium fontiphilum]MBB3982550.1 CRISPR system Cascade subunit CasA [Sphingobium fontiphilum]